MNNPDSFNRRRFLEVAGAAGAASAFGAWSFRARAELRPARLRFGHLADTRFTDQDDPEKSRKLDQGWLYGHTYALADDLMAQFAALGPDPVKLILHSGQLCWKGGEAAAAEWKSKSSLPVHDTGGCFDFSGSDGYCIIMQCGPGCVDAHDEEGLHFIHLASNPNGSLYDGQRQLEALQNDLAKNRAKPTVLVMHPSLLAFDLASDVTLAERDRNSLIEVMKKNPQLLLALSGKALANRAGFAPGTNALCLVTAAPAIYPCGARLMDLEVKPGGEVTIVSRFIQTRRLELVENSFEYGDKAAALSRLGRREDRGLTAVPRELELKRTTAGLDPNLAPWFSSESAVTLAVVSDTHLCLDKFVSEKDLEENQLIGHFNEDGSRKILEDILDQVKAGRHRVEFFDEAFARDPGADKNYLHRKVDALLLCGDLVEHGRREEAEIMKAMLNGLPEPLRGRTRLAVGNHDFFGADFAPDHSASSRDLIAEFYQGYGPTGGRANYAVELSDWASLIVLDSVIAGISTLGLPQDELDWLEDQLASRRDKIVLVAAHHTLYQLSLVPWLMYKYLQSRSHFTPPQSAARVLAQDRFAKYNNVKLVISGHYHGVVADQFKKARPAGNAADDAFTTHVQVPCTVEYPNGYRLFTLSREGERARLQYQTAYTRRAELRAESGRALMFQLMGGQVRFSREQEKIFQRLGEKDNFFMELAKLNPSDLVDLDVRGFKDGTANRGLGNTGKPNIKGKLEFKIGQ